MLTFILIFVYMILLPLSVIIMLIKIREDIEKLQESKEVKPNKNRIAERRRHTSIGTANYNSVFNRRDNAKEYDIYKNNNKLYEPVTPHKPGVKIHEKED